MPDGRRGPDLHRLALVSLSLGYVMITLLCVHGARAAGRTGSQRRETFGNGHFLFTDIEGSALRWEKERTGQFVG